MEYKQVRIAADTEGGDPINGVPPIERMVAGAVDAVKQDDKLTVVLSGNKQDIESFLSKHGYEGRGIEITERGREKYLFRRLVNMHRKGEVDGVYTAWNTQYVTPTITSKSKLGMIVDDLKLPPLVSKMPYFKLTKKDGTSVTDVSDLDFNDIADLEFGHYFALDLGANRDCSAQNLYEFAVMAKYYVNSMSGKENPRIALLNIGGEDKKGNEIDIETYQKLQQSPELNFVGNVEKPILRGDLTDIVVTDGRTGNVFLKTSEATADFVKIAMKYLIKREADFLTKIRCSGVPKATKKINELTDSATYGGAPALGIDGHVVKTHGTFCKTAAKNGLILTAKYARANTVQAIKNELVYS